MVLLLKILNSGLEWLKRSLWDLIMLPCFDYSIFIVINHLLGLKYISRFY